MMIAVNANEDMKYEVSPIDDEKIAVKAIDNTKRILKEFEELSEDVNDAENNLWIRTALVGDDLKHWKVTILGPSDTCYAGGTFVIDI